MQFTVTDWLDNSAINHPNNIALVDENRSITYAEYRQKSLEAGMRISFQKYRLIAA
ncbi:MAG TPA: hypothetical protein PKW49_03730 [Paludibacteraceae bacterium]|nr:hypothetical protein [Paludibacteraceae bacterium]HQF50468.1 hypothetical protein [Paludibacteraceae bacterium]HQJ89390.1 hypothetical protein [Paludibacteraceae bacterium]